MSSAKEYREYADECMGWAKSAKTDHERDLFLQMAKAWMDAALIARGALSPLKPLSNEGCNAPASDDLSL
jgi:hypothetical protein